MKRVLRSLLYGLAMLAGISGLVAGGKSLGKYAWARMNDPYFDSFSYNDLVFSGGVIFLLSLILLIFAEVGSTLSRTFNPPKPKKADSASKKSGGSPKTASPGDLPTQAPEVEDQTDQESADEKLARILKPKQDR